MNFPENAANHTETVTIFGDYGTNYNLVRAMRERTRELKYGCERENGA